MAKITITDITQFRAGDWIEGEHKEDDRWYRFAGEARPFRDRIAGIDPDLGLRAAGLVIRARPGGQVTAVRELIATREAPVPPQELGSVILDVTITSGLEFKTMMRMDTVHGPLWRGARGPGFSDADLVSWTTSTPTPGERVDL